MQVTLFAHCATSIYRADAAGPVATFQQKIWIKRMDRDKPLSISHFSLLRCLLSTCTHARTHARTHACTHTHAHTHTHTHTPCAMVYKVALHLSHSNAWCAEGFKVLYLHRTLSKMHKRRCRRPPKWPPTLNAQLFHLALIGVCISAGRNTEDRCICLNPEMLMGNEEIQGQQQPWQEAL